MVPDDHLQKRDTKPGKKQMYNGNDTIGLNNDTIGGFAAGPAMGGQVGGTKLDVTNDPNNTLNFYVSALKKEENQKSETGGEEY